MIKNLNKKKLVIGIVLLFFGAVIVPSINANIINTTEKNSIVTSPIISSPSSKNDDWWPMYRHDPENTGCSSSITPIRNQLSWMTNVGDIIYSAEPIVYNDKMFISTGFFYDFLHSLDLTISNILEWPSISEILEYLTTYNEYYYGGVYCLDADDGTYLWDYPMYAPSDPAVVDSKVYVSDLDLYTYNSSFYCFDAATGNLIWQKPMDGLVTSSTVIVNNKIYLCCLDFYTFTGTMYCLDLNGNIIWDYPLQTEEALWFITPAVSDGRVFFTSLNLFYYYSEPGTLYCLDANSGQYLWSQPLSSFYVFLSSPVCALGNLYIVDIDIYSYEGYVKCLNPATGNLKWLYNIQLSLGTPAVCEEGLFITDFNFYSYNGWLYRLDPITGVLKWKIQLPDPHFFTFFCSPTCANDKVFITGAEDLFYSSDLYCLNMENGSEIWNYSLDRGSLVTPSVADEKVYIGDIDGNVYAFEDMLKIGAISGSLLSLKVELKNIADSDISDVEWAMSVCGGIFGGIDENFYGKFSTIKSGNTKTATCSPVFGLGKVKIEVKATMPGQDDILIKKANGFVLGIIVIMLS